VDACTALPEIASALPYEPGPEALPAAFPVVTMLADLYGQVDRETGPVTDNTWGWEVRVYVDLTQGYEAAQVELDDAVPAVLSVIRADPSLDGSCEWARIEDPGGPPEFGVERNRRYAVKRLLLRAELFET
jgi:hypothetical protein